MESERDKHLSRILELVEYRRQPGFGIVIDLGKEKEKREARMRHKRSRLPQVAGPREENSGPDAKE